MNRKIIRQRSDAMFKLADKFKQEVFCFPVWGQISNLSPERMQVKHNSPHISPMDAMNAEDFRCAPSMAHTLWGTLWVSSALCDGDKTRIRHVTI